MKKIGLKLDALTVESFETEAGAKVGGTVHALEDVSAPNPCLPQTAIQTCQRKQTYYESCVAYCPCTDAIRACLA
jgi:hypothetical protein